MNSLSDCRIAQERLLHDRDFRRVDLLQGKDVDHAGIDQSHQANDCEEVFEEFHRKSAASAIRTKRGAVAVSGVIRRKVSSVSMRAL